MGKVYEIKEFLQLVNDKCIIDYDGIGYFGNENTELETIKHVDIPTVKKAMKRYTHVHWYNR